MNLSRLTVLLLCCSLFLNCNRATKKVYAGKRTVEIREQNGQYQLYRNGEPYLIKGAAILDCKYLRELKKRGGNSVRIYSTDNAQEILDSAYKLGLTVEVGLKMSFAGREMDYNNPEAVQAQYERLRQDILKYRNHPALLMWGVGNEPHIFLKPSLRSATSYFRVWKAVNNIAKMVHELDPNHPTTTMIPGDAQKTLDYISSYCDQIDIFSFNSFGPLQEQLKETGWKGPYVISEFGAYGYWKSHKTDWYSRVEQTSYEKAAFFQNQYHTMQSSSGRCLGSYVFVWGQKQEYTTTWFSLFTEEGQPTELVDALQYLWTGDWPADRAPSIDSFTIDNKSLNQNIYLQAGKKYTASFKVPVTTAEKLRLHWEIQIDEVEYLDASYDPIKNRILTQGSRPLLITNKRQAGKVPAEAMYNLEFEAPKTEGPFRLFLFLKDDHNKVATANACFYVLH